MKKYFPEIVIIICIIGIFVSFKYVEKSSKEKNVCEKHYNDQRWGENRFNNYNN